MSEGKRIDDCPIQPVNDNIVVVPLREGVSEGGIIMPDKVRDPLPKCKVVAVGGGHVTNKGPQPLSVKCGDLVLLDHRPMVLPGTVYGICQESNVLGIWKGKTKNLVQVGPADMAAEEELLKAAARKVQGN